MAVSWDDYEKIGLRVGTVTRVEDFPEARKPAYKLWIDLGDMGTKKSSARLTKLYRKEDLVGRQVVCVTGFPPKQVGGFMSEVLVTGVVQGEEVVLLGVDKKVPDGAKVE